MTDAIPHEGRVRSCHAALGALVALGLCLNAPPTLAAGPPNQTEMKAVQTWKAALEEIAAHRAKLDATEKALEARYGFNGSKTTVTSALEAGGVDGDAERLPSRLYFLWRQTQPFFARHRATLEQQAQAIEEQGFIHAHDLVWLRESHAALHTFADTLAQGMAGAVHLAVRREQTAAKLAPAKANLAVSRRTMGGVESQGMADLLTQAEEAVTQALAELDAAEASLVAHEVSVKMDAGHAVVPAFIPVGKRPLARLEHIDFEQDARTAPKVPEPANAPTADSVTAMSVKAVEGQAALEKLSAERDATLARAGEHLAAAAKTERLLTEIKDPADLPEVRALMVQRGELEAQIKAKRQEIGTIDLQAPNGREAAKRTAQEVLALQQEAPAINAELIRMQSPSYMAGWRRHIREEVAKQRAKAMMIQQDAAKLAQGVFQAQVEVVRSQGQLIDGALQSYLEQASQLAATTNAQPDLLLIHVVRPGQEEEESVLTVERPTTRSLIEAVTQMQVARTALTQSVESLAKAWESMGRSAKAAAERPTVLAKATLDKVLAKIWKSTVKRLALKGHRGATGRTLRRSFAALPSDTPIPASSKDTDTVPAGDLALVLERFEEVLTSSATQKLFRKLVGRELRRAGEEADDGSPIVERVARTLEFKARLPLLRLARHAHTQAQAKAEQAGNHADTVYRGIDPLAGGRVTKGAPLRVGDPVTITLTFKSNRRGRCPGVRIGPHAIPVQGQAKRKSCHYRSSRLGDLPGDDATLHISRKP